MRTNGAPPALNSIPGTFSSIGNLVCSAADTLRPPERLKVSEASEKYIYINQPGAWVGPYQNSTAPYMVEPMDTYTSRVYSGMIFVGPAQCGKTQSLLLNTVAYSIVIDSMDTILYCPTQAAARDFSTRRIDRMHRNSAEVGKQLRRERDADNKFDKHYKSGMILSISWPSAAELAGRPIGRVMLTDRDRMPDDIDGEGEPYDLASKRTTTFGSFAMTVAESSPSRPVTDPKWVKKSPHEAPPTGGILGLYNRGDRRRYYWPCPDCGSYFEGNFKHLTWDKVSNTLAASRSVRMICPHCSFHIHPDSRYDMLQRGRWVADGQGVEPDGTVYGPQPGTEIASFWLNGVAAAFSNWQSLVNAYITADQSFDRNGDEDALKKFYNNDLGEPYMPKSMEAERLPEVLQARAEDLGGSAEDPVVPEGVRFLLATVDVQQNMFICQVHGICPGEPEDIIIVDRFRIRLSDDRLDEDGQVSWVKPGTYLEDWDLITEKVIKRTYPLGDGSGRRMMIKMTGCDSGGKAGVTSNAYEFYRKLRKSGLAGRFCLIKGRALPGAPRAQVTYPDSSNAKVKAAAQGDVPVLQLQSNHVKDMASNRLDGLMPGKGMVRYPLWLPDWFYAELCTERRTEKGWENPPHSRNEAWDLLYYCIGVAISPLLSIEGIDWNNPPRWCATWDENNLVVAPEQIERFALPRKRRYDIEELARSLA